MNYKNGRYCKKEIFCMDCNIKLKGNSNPLRCRPCSRKFLYRNGRQYPTCLDCGIKLKTYHSIRCLKCSHTGKNSSVYKDGRTLKKDYMNNYCKNKRLIDLNFRISGNLRSRIRIALKGICKSISTSKLLGCHIDFFRLYLQSKFQPGMSFSNYGKWHIDHIIPCARFDLEKESEQKICFNYKNLQPLWAEENLRKNDK